MSAQRHAIAGLGVTRQGRLPGQSSVDLRVEALQLAVRDAGLKMSDIGGYIYQPGMVEMNSYCVAGDTPKLAGMSPALVWQVQSGGTSAITSVVSACAALDQGLCNYVAIGYGDTALSSATSIGAGSFLNATPYDTLGAYGMFSAAADHALAAQRHMHEYGTTREHLAAVALSARSYANLREDAFMHDRKLTLEDHLGARMIAEPLGKFDCCLIADGGCAMIITTAERARDLPSKPVYIRGSGFGHSMRESFLRSAYRESGHAACETALRNADVTRDDLDVLQLYDCFTITMLMTLEALGFCGRGESGPYVAEGNLGLDGKFPTNTSGGELAWGYMQGYTPIVEAVRQLRGEGGTTQVPDARLCLVNGHGGTTKDAGYMEYADACMVLERAA